MERNMTLLTQEEIDTLVTFLEEKRGRMSDEVLSQESIDKLIRFVQGSGLPVSNFDRFLSDINNEKYLREMGLREGDQVCELLLEQEADGFIKLVINNTVTGKSAYISPDGFAKQDLSVMEGKWGLSIMPAFFDQIAQVYGLKYSKETFERVCRLFAEKNFGDKDAEISAAFLPDDGMVNRVMEA